MVFEALPLTNVDGGLFSAATVERTTSINTGWANGNSVWDSDACPVELDITGFCDGSMSGPIAKADGYTKEGYPFGAITTYSCSSVGYSLEERRRTAREQIKAGIEKAVERELQKGEAAIANGHFDVHYLTDADAVDLKGATTAKLELGIASLEQALADCGLGLQGVIHMSRGAALVAAANKLIERKGTKFFTRLGTPVAAGTGYDQSATKAAAKPTTSVNPALVAPKALATKQLIYATGPVAVHLGPVEILDEIVDRKTNTITIVGSKPALVYMDSCCHFLIEVDLT